MRIQNNIMAVNTHRQYNGALGGVSKSAEKLSSGYRINRAGDDAAGLAISEKMRAQIRGLDMASKNSQDAVSLVQTAEGALQETHNILQRMRELAVQSASDTNETSIDRAALQQEFSQLRDEVNDIASKTRFNDQNLIDGTFQKYTRSVNAAVTTTQFMANINNLSVGASVEGNYIMSIEVVTAQAAITVTGVAASVSFYAPNTAIGDILGEGADILGENSFEEQNLGAISGIKFEGLHTNDHNGNIYELVIDGASKDDMSFELKDSKGNTVSRINGVDASTWVNGGNYKVDFEGVGSMSFTMQGALDTPEENVAIDVSTLKTASGVKMQFSETGKKQQTTPEVEAALKLTINGESVTLKKGDTSANFKQAGIAFDFNPLSDTDFVNASRKFYDPVNMLTLATEITEAPDDAGSPVTPDDGASLATITISVKSSKGAEMVIQTGANEGDNLGINIDAMNAEMLGIQYSSIADRAAASRAITEVNNAVNKVSTQRATLGALQNRLEYKISNLDTSSENLTASESRIRDVDMAKEMTKFTKQNILVQASTAMLAQANQAPQGVLSLIG